MDKLKVGQIVRFVKSGSRATVVAVRKPHPHACLSNLIDLVSEGECGIWSEFEDALNEFVVVADYADYRRDKPLGRQVSEQNPTHSIALVVIAVVLVACTIAGLVLVVCPTA